MKKTEIKENKENKKNKERNKIKNWTRKVDAKWRNKQDKNKDKEA